MITREELLGKYFSFFKKKGHVLIQSASLIPENDPTVLFTTAGMHPLVPFIMGQQHPQGKRLVDVQKCIRTGDIDEVGDTSHLSFFEMLGNWSLGDYFKKESIEWSYEFLTKELKFDKEKIYVTCFKGDKNAPKDEESANIWKSLGIPEEKIFFLGRKDNWWGPVGNIGPCGPDTEIFIDTGKEFCSKKCQPGCSCGKFIEVWNNVFIEYNKTKAGDYEKLEQKSVDTGMGVERTVAMLNNKTTVYETEIFEPLIEEIKNLARLDGNLDEVLMKQIRIIADHARAATFILAEEIAPSNVDQGYILRRFIRRAIRHGKVLNIEQEFLTQLAEKIIEQFGEDYLGLKKNKKFIIEELKKEDEKFRRTLIKGINKFQKLIQEQKKISGKDAFLMFQSYGFPLEMIIEEAAKYEISLSNIDIKGFHKEYEKHQALSKKGAEKRFKGGLADASEETTKLHTAAHLLAEALRRVLSPDIKQKGSNITTERLRFDFNFDRKVAPEELNEIEDMVNNIIQQGIEVEKMEMTLDEAKKMGAHGEFEAKYGQKVFVYKIGDFSLEICGGPHVKNTKELGHFKIIKEQSSSAGVRRIKAILT